VSWLLWLLWNGVDVVSELAGREPRLKAVAGAEIRLRHEATIFLWSSFC
jgi:hypothetical protein